MQEMLLLKKELEKYKDWCAEFGEKYSNYMKYAKEFADQLKEDYVFFNINTDILPIVFHTDFKKDHDYKSKTYTAGEYIKYGNQSIINIYCSMDNDVEVKQRIRHEVLHYCLGMNEMNSSDDSAIFHYLCGVYDADAYKEMSDEEQKLYEKLLGGIDTLEKLYEKGIVAQELVKCNVIGMTYTCGCLNKKVTNEELFENGLELLEMLNKIDMEQIQQECPV